MNVSVLWETITKPVVFALFVKSSRIFVCLFIIVYCILCKRVLCTALYNMCYELTFEKFMCILKKKKLFDAFAITLLFDSTVEDPKILYYYLTVKNFSLFLNCLRRTCSLLIYRVVHLSSH